jgi:hypothetical protein
MTRPAPVLFGADGIILSDPGQYIVDLYVASSILRVTVDVGGAPFPPAPPTPPKPPVPPKQEAGMGAGDAMSAALGAAFPAMAAGFELGRRMAGGGGKK